MATITATATATATATPTPMPVPNKHIPFCPTGLPSTSPPTPHRPADSTTTTTTTSSLLHPPPTNRLLLDHPPIYSLTAAGLQSALDHLSTQPLPPPDGIFPWLHGLHPNNHLQRAFFASRHQSLDRVPTALRGLTVIKAGGDLSHSCIRGAVAPNEVLRPLVSYSCSNADADADCCDFLELDSPQGFSVRNFHIQPCKMATLSDIVVYGDLERSPEEVQQLAVRVAKAQAAWQGKTQAVGGSRERRYNTFVLMDDYEVIETDYPDMIAVDAQGRDTGKVVDLAQLERVEMCAMSAPTEIAHNVWLGPTPDSSLCPAVAECGATPPFDIMIEASDVARIPSATTLRELDASMQQKSRDNGRSNDITVLDFPASGVILPPTWSQAEVDGLLATCEWIHRHAHGVSTERPKRRDSKLSISPPSSPHTREDEYGPSSAGHKILIHCTDGYTETTLLGLAYYMYATCAPTHTAWLDLHLHKQRNLFAYSSDVALLRVIQPRLLQASPCWSGDIAHLCPSPPDWLDHMDGSLPSRILPEMYLGNLGHANNPALLRALGIGQILSVGETLTWPQSARAEWPPDRLMFVACVQDNGIDPLLDELDHCLEFIDRGRRAHTATLVHCRVGVSRSATICIAEVMRARALSLPRAYCFVRARRLNVIIQPHLRFCYELLQWEERLCARRGQPVRREVEWATLARDIAALNRPYARP